jgi:hypothetical protein
MAIFRTWVPILSKVPKSYPRPTIAGKSQEMYLLNKSGAVR